MSRTAFRITATVFAAIMFSLPGAACGFFVVSELHQFGSFQSGPPQTVNLGLLIFFPILTAYIGGRVTFLALRPDSGPGFCTKCNYNLCGNMSGICPECGTPIEDQSVR